MSASEEKTEKPTPKKVKESRKEGQVARTQELGAWAALLLATVAFPAAFRYEIRALDELMSTALDTINDPTTDRALELLSTGFWHAFVVLIVLSSGMLVISAAVTLTQGGFYLATKAVKPKAAKLNPIKGIKRIFGPQAAWEGVKMLVKCAMVALLVYTSVKAMMPLLGGMVPMGVVLSLTGDRAMSLLRSVGAAGLLMAALDYVVVRRRTGKQTRMSKNEIKQEHKQQEGDPLLKGAIRSRQIAASRNRMLADLTNADVVLVNPTHVAVALRYEAERGAPVVVARGAGLIAARIRETAAEHDVPLVQDVPLARALYGSTEVGQEIPAELFAAVAHVLAFVISRRTRGVNGGTHRSPRTESDLPEVPAIGRRRRRTPDSDGARTPAT
ncbi:EscU/YscU/HrcU family type III secretion system export apparatus switch protein [Nocardioides sp.]|uniref:EscU/YscU/HrcU family type III secretion system export apparatus switch protein n=1 Tax=Nocardioides sp. TaxID=35761 RepID=UPI002B26ED0E|nr:EscU/YscU/HrcU family type III secretion system export apparatus switch protein [Nocardioides sp.]